MTKKNTTIRLAFCSFGILEQGGGFENYMVETSRGLNGYRNVFETAIITSTPRLTERLQTLLTIYFLKKHDKSSIYREEYENVLKRLGNTEYIRVSNLNELINNINRYDYVYVKNEILELVILRMIKRRLRSKVIIGIHTPIHYPYAPSLSAKLHNLLYTGRFYKLLLRSADSIKVNNDDDKKYLNSKYQLTNVETIHHAFNIELGRQQKNRDKSLRILFVGRITEQKGLDILLKVINRSLSRGLNYKFKIAGSGEKELVTELIKLSDKYANVEYLGHIKNDEISSLYDWCDVSIIPSKYETLNKVAIETAIAGKIAISSDIPGPREVIDSGVTGYLIQPTYKNFVAKLEQVDSMKKNDPKKLSRIGLKAQEKIHNDFNPNKVYKEFYNQLLIDV